MARLFGYAPDEEVLARDELARQRVLENSLGSVVVTDWYLVSLGTSLQAVPPVGILFPGKERGDCSPDHLSCLGPEGRTRSGVCVHDAAVVVEDDDHVGRLLEYRFVLVARAGEFRH